jgi:protein-S-isoprenylcysteine O-methyltransferase Ste14
MLALVLLALRNSGARRALRSARLLAPGGVGVIAGGAGLALCVLGMGLAVWARVHLGRNWGAPRSRKEDPELVTSGPYRFIRHPIYTGVLLAMLGSAIAQNLFWLAPLAIFGAYFIYSARAEEKIMLEAFPQQYSAYMRRTKMLVPFVL